jgi:hypothetical protein
VVNVEMKDMSWDHYYDDLYVAASKKGDDEIDDEVFYQYE